MIDILLVGNIHNIHIKKFSEYLNKANEGDIHVDYFHLDYEFTSEINNVIYPKRNFLNFLYNISGFRNFLFMLDLCLSFMKVKKKYDLVNLHYLTIHSFVLLPLYRIIGNKVMISPWGSDVNRINGLRKFLYQKIYNKADFISVPAIEFRKTVQKKFRVPDEKIVDVGFGSEMIDFILSRKHISKQKSKNILGIKDSYVIACGYNRSAAQNHSIMIDSIIENKDILPKNSVLLFLLTYGESYDLTRQFEMLDNNAIPFMVFDKFIDNEKLFDVQNATDLFIHIQDTDANSAFMQEFLLCDALVLNGAWLRYTHLEKEGMPYFQVEQKTSESLSFALKSILSKQININTTYAKVVIAGFGWSSQIKRWYAFFRRIKL